MRATTWADVGRKDVEERSYRSLGTIPGANGGTYERVTCPFCNHINRLFVWSLRGSGKRCEVKECRALFGSLGVAYRLKEKDPALP